MSQELIELLDTLHPTLRAAFLRAVADVTSEAQLAVIVAHLEAGQIDLAMQALNLRPEFFAPLDDAMAAAFLAGGRATLAGLPAIPDPFRASGSLSAFMAVTRARKGSSAS